ncbi:MAG: hypothetical protein ABJQ98_12775 [Alloalcanivorax venustensis]|jgi:hypothetical protein|uniref:hypothetical protein n=1 Tax=Alloalcanivorax venustensis TaxID=172371 RepID=UPI003299DA7B
MSIKTKAMIFAMTMVGIVGAASAAPATYQGTTVLTNPVTGSVTCLVTIAGDIDGSGNIQVQSVGAEPGDANCDLIYNGQTPWTGNTSGSTLTTGSASSIIVVGTSVASSCGGTISQIVYNGLPGIPTSVDINPGGVVGNYGGSCTIEGNLVRIN